MNGITSAIEIAPRAIGVTVTDDRLTVDLEDGRSITVPIGWYRRSAYGTPEERQEISEPVLATAVFHSSNPLI